MRILVVDRARGTVGAQLLLRLRGLGCVELVHDGATALHRFEQALGERRPFELVCLALGLPDMDGGFVVRRLRRMETDAEARAFLVMWGPRPGPRHLRRLVDRWLADRFAPCELDDQLNRWGLVALA